MNETELYHYGVKGMKWGVRRARSKERAALNAASKAVTDKRKKEFLSAAEKHRKDADRIREAHTKAKSEKKNMRLNKDGTITEITRSEQVARGKKIANGIAKGAMAGAFVSMAVTTAAAIRGWQLAEQMLQN